MSRPAAGGDPTWPLDAFDRRLDPGSRAPLAVAFSGGGDSLAALLATKAWADRAGRRVIVFTVDHRLQPQGRAWVGVAQGVARRIGAAFEALAWDGDKPTTGLAAAARAARHRLLAAAARRQGAQVIVLGHTADDIAEAALMRAEGSSVGAPREWAPSPAWPEGRDVFLLRPLLDLRRAAIRERLMASGETWIEDPANENPASLRARVRAKIGGADEAILLPLGEKAAAEGGRRGRAGRSAAVLTRHRNRRCDPSSGPSGHLLPQGEKESWNYAAGALILDRLAFREAADPARMHVLGAALTCVGGGDRPPRGDRLVALAGRLAGEGEVAATLAGAKLIADASRILIVRNPGEAARGGLAPLALAPGETRVWDGRFEIVAGDEAVVIEPVAGHARGLDPQARSAIRTLPVAVRGGLPSYRTAAGDRICPILAQAGPLRVRSLVAARFHAATGMISKEPAT